MPPELHADDMPAGSDDWPMPTREVFRHLEGAPEWAPTPTPNASDDLSEA
jgi:hypothetical protein